MGDLRFRSSYQRVRDADNQVAALRRMSDEGVVEALAAASEGSDPLVANFLATEATNRMHRSRRILDNLAEGVIASDRAGYVTLINPTAARLLGWVNEEALGTPLSEVLRARALSEAGTPEGEPLVLGDASLGEGSHHFARAVIEGKWPRRFQASLSVSPILRDNDFTGAVITFLDTHVEQESERLRMEFRALWEGITDGIITKSTDGRVTAWNPACERLYGYTSEEVLGHPVPELLYTEEESARESDAFNRARAGESVRGHFARRRRKDGAIFAVEVTLLPVRDEHGEVTRILSLQHPMAEPRARRTGGTSGG